MVNNSTRKWTYDIGNLGPGLGQAQKCGRVKPVNGIPTLPLLIIRSSIPIQILQTIKNSTDLLQLEKTAYYHKNKWWHKHGQYNSRVNEWS